MMQSSNIFYQAQTVGKKKDLLNYFLLLLLKKIRPSQSNWKRICLWILLWIKLALESKR